MFTEGAREIQRKEGNGEARRSREAGEGRSDGRSHGNDPHHLPRDSAKGICVFMKIQAVTTTVEIKLNPLFIYVLTFFFFEIYIKLNILVIFQTEILIN